MKTLYLDCSMGAAGDMLAAALIELLPEPEAFLRKLNELNIPQVVMSLEKRIKCGITGTGFRVLAAGQEEDENLHAHSHDHHHPHHHDHHHDHEHPHDHPHSHNGLEDIRRIVYTLPIPMGVKLDVLAVYQEIAQAESHAHGVPVKQIHFHEVGTMDALADITAVCMLLHELHPDQILASPVHVGSGTVRCAHGILPVPAPATAYILRNVPICSGTISGELCTPTGAALLKHFVTEFTAMPTMSVEAIGYGMGKKDFPQANCLRALLGQTQESGDEIVKLECNLDDITGEALGHALEELMAAGALDVFTSPIGMKKSRPGTLLTVLCRQEQKQALVQEIFRNTTTLGIRESGCTRYTLRREIRQVNTPFGPVQKKVSTGYGVTREKYEYEDLSRLAKAHNMTLLELMEKL